jgi:HipA-like protein
MDLKAFCEFERKRMLVGTLTRDAGTYTFVYSKSWLFYDGQFQLGPDLPLSEKPYRSKKMFQAFLGRIPPRSSENYARYCEERGIKVDESDLFVLLGTIGHKGASSFVFELDDSDERQAKVLTAVAALVDEFSYDIIAAAFGITKTGLYKLLTKKVPVQNSSIYSVLEICIFNIDAARWKISSSLYLPDKLKHKIITEIKRMSGRSDNLVKLSE